MPNFNHSVSDIIQSLIDNFDDAVEKMAAKNDVYMGPSFSFPNRKPLTYLLKHNDEDMLDNIFIAKSRYPFLQEMAQRHVIEALAPKDLVCFFEHSETMYQAYIAHCQNDIKLYLKEAAEINLESLAKRIEDYSLSYVTSLIEDKLPARFMELLLLNVLQVLPLTFMLPHVLPITLLAVGLVYAKAKLVYCFMTLNTIKDTLTMERESLSLPSSPQESEKDTSESEDESEDESEEKTVVGGYSPRLFSPIASTMTALLNSENTSSNSRR